jgi:gamma-glutamyltranspeptidase/glutathione hydrolase
MTDALRTKPAAVATHHPIAAAVAREVLVAGGNAVDASVAAMAALCVVLPGAVGFGGFGGSMICYLAGSGQTVCLDFDSRAPLAYRDELYAVDAKHKSTTGYLSVGVPAVVAGLAASVREFGTLPLDRVLGRAVELAERGFPMEADTRRLLIEQWRKTADAASLHAHFPGGEIPQVGEIWVQKDLARMIRRIADEGADCFYRGEVAQRIVRQVQQHGGILAEEDLATYAARRERPLGIDYRGHTILTAPPPSGGVTMLQILRTLEQFDVGSMDPWSAPYLHVVAEVCKRCWTDRDKIGDPDHVTLDYAELLSAAVASARATDVRQHDVETGVESAIDDMPHTSNVSIVDGDGNCCSLTATQGAQFGSGVVIEGLGLVLGHGMSRFVYGNRAHPNRPLPGKRPTHNMAPVLVLKNGRPVAVLGMPGGTRIPTVTAQMIVSLVDFKASPEQAVHAPRVHAESGEPIVVSDVMPAATARQLQAMGHTLTRGQHALGVALNIGGPANVVRIAADGTLSAASGFSRDAARVL